MFATTFSAGAIWGTLTKEKQAWCNLQVKLCDPCLSVLRRCIEALYKYSSFLFFKLMTPTTVVFWSSQNSSSRLHYRLAPSWSCRPHRGPRGLHPRNTISPYPLHESIQRILNSTQQDITDVGADTSYVHIYMSNLIKNFVTLKLLLIGFRFRSSQL